MSIKKETEFTRGVVLGDPNRPETTRKFRVKVTMKHQDGDVERRVGRSSREKCNVIRMGYWWEWGRGSSHTPEAPIEPLVESRYVP